MSAGENQHAGAGEEEDATELQFPKGKKCICRDGCKAFLKFASYNILANFFTCCFSDKMK